MFDVDRVLDVRKAASLKAEAAGIRYTCVIWGKEKQLFRDDDAWFVEVDDPPGVDISYEFHDAGVFTLEPLKDERKPRKASCD